MAEKSKDPVNSVEFVKQIQMRLNLHGELAFHHFFPQWKYTSSNLRIAGA